MSQSVLKDLLYLRRAFNLIDSRIQGTEIRLVDTGGQ